MIRLSITKNKQDNLLWWLYIPVGLIVLYAFFIRAITTPLFGDGYLVFLLLGIVIALFPIRTEDRIFSFVSGISVATFSVYGLVPEMFISSIATVIALAVAGVKLDQHYRYPLNLLAVNVLSVVSASAYILTEQLLLAYDLEELTLLPLAVYLLVNILTNQVQIYLTDKYIYQQTNVHFFNNLLTFSMRTGTYLLPLSYILLYLEQTMGLLGVIVGAIPFITVTIGTKQYYTSKHYNIMLMEVSLAAQKLSFKTKYREVIQSFIHYVFEIFPAQRIYYFSMGQDDTIKLNHYYSVNDKLERTEDKISFSNHPELLKVLETKSLSVYEKAVQWRTYAYNEEKYSPESAVVIPVVIADKKEGVILVTHSNQAVYDDFLSSLIDVFYQYFNIVLANVNQLRQLRKSNYTDYLTQIPNLSGFYRRFESILEEDNFQELSLVVIDLDHFKCVNDVHGHEAGNEVLVQIADTLKRFTTESCFVSRYGGEEFLFLIKDMTKEETFELAEKIRKKIAKTDFTIKESIATDEPVTVHLTASLGLAHYPDDQEDVHTLVKLADRAMYSGSKQRGRNMVTAYSSKI